MFAHSTFRRERHMRPRIRVILLYHSRGAKQLNSLFQHFLSKFGRSVFLGENPVTELELIGTTRNIGVHRHRTHDRAVWLRDIDEPKQNVWKHASNLRRHGGKNLKLVLREITFQLIDHLYCHARRREGFELLLDREFFRIKASNPANLSRQVNATERMPMG